MAHRALINLSSVDHPKWKTGTVVYNDPLNHRFYYAILDEGERLVNIHKNQIKFLNLITDEQTKPEANSNAS